ncbi:unnamed protein product [Boreogadus saida]
MNRGGVLFGAGRAVDLTLTSGLDIDRRGLNLSDVDFLTRAPSCLTQNVVLRRLSVCLSASWAWLCPLPFWPPTPPPPPSSSHYKP